MMTKLFLIGLLCVLLSACPKGDSNSANSNTNSNASNTGNNSAKPNTANSDKSEKTETKPTNSSENKSTYTSLKTEDCKTIESETEGAGWYRGECPGVAGFKLELTEGDLRQSINVIVPSKKKFELDFSKIAAGFSAIGEKAEWRLKGDKPVALIVRFNVSDAENSEKNTSYLVVSKISETAACVTDVVKPGASQNDEAQKFADSASTKPCKTF